MYIFRILFATIFLVAAVSQATIGAQSKSTNQDGLSSKLLEACKKDDKTAAKAAIKAGANVNAQDSLGNTPLIFAAQSHDMQLIDILLQSGSKVIMQNDNGENAIDVLGENSNGIEAKLKLQFAIARDKALAEQLMQAIIDNNTTKALDLLKQGAYIDYKNKSIEQQPTPLLLALDLGNIEVAKAIIKAGARVERAADNGATPLFFAIGSIEITRLLIDAGANVNARLKDGVYLITAAVISKSTSAVQILIDAGADVNSVNSEGDSSLHYAADAGDVDMVKFLLTKKAVVDKESKVQGTPLHHALDKMHPDVVAELLKAGANPNKKTNKGATPLMFAALKGDLASAKLLLQNGADADLTNDTGETALAIAQKHKQTEIVAVLTSSAKTRPVEQTVSEMKKEIDSDQVRILFKAVSTKNIEQVAALLKGGFSPNVKNEKGETALMIAAENEDVVSANLLLTFGADINAQDNEGMTALMHAVAKDSLFSTANLIKKEAKKDIKDKQGRTALSIAQEGKGIVLMMYAKDLKN